MKNIFITLIIILLIGIGAFFLFQTETKPEEFDTNNDSMMEENQDGTMEENQGDTEREPVETIGQSVNGAAITAHHFGEGDTELLFIGGIHAGYGPGTVLVAQELIADLESGDIVVPENTTVTVIPVLNPDGLQDITGKTSTIVAADIPSTDRTDGRFNGNNVDLNRNFDCNWEAKGVWQSQTVSGGSAPFSEPEAQAIKTYVERYNPVAVVVYYSQAGEVVAGNCADSVSAKTKVLMNAYANASGYTAKESFDYYEVNGDLTNWLVSIDIPSVGILLGSHTSAEWSKNKAGVEAVLEAYTQ